MPMDLLPPRSGAVPGEDGCESHGCWAWAGWNDRRDMRGAGARLSIELPATAAPDHSLAEVSLHLGPEERDILEVGWEVAPRRYADAVPHLFVHRWIDGRPCEGDCGLRRWSPRLFPGMPLGAWAGRMVGVGWLLWQGRAWAWVDGEWLGAFDLAPRNSRLASMAQWFGEVFFVHAPPRVAMGNGRSVREPAAARFDRVCDVPPDADGCVVRSARFPRVTEPDRYPLRVDGPGGFRYGGPGEAPAGVGPAPTTDVDGAASGTAAPARLRPRPPPSSASGEMPAATGR